MVDPVDAQALKNSAEGEAAGEAHKPGLVPIPNDTEGVEFE